MNIGKKIIKNMVEGCLLKVTFKAIRNFSTKLRSAIDWVLCISARYVMAKCCKVNPNKIVFMTYNNDYMCNPKYICEEILRQSLPVDIVWATVSKKKHSGQFPEGVRLVIRGKYEFFKEVATAGVWVDNALCFPWNPMPKKKDQFYLQTWHGSLGLKRIGKEQVGNRRWSFAASLAGKWTDLCISNSSFETDVFRQTHWPDTPILELGHARNDILFADDARKSEIKKKVCEFYDIQEDVKIALYAPTFRNTPGDSSYSLDYPRLLDALVEKFGGEWVLLNRFHFKTKSVSSGTSLDERIYAATLYPDMQELMVAADVGITDYSSWICDFVLTGRPGFIYAPDLSDYDQERGFYYPLSDIPFPVAENNDEMESNLRTFDLDIYTQECSLFLQERGCIEDGHASEKIVDIIKKRCGISS